MPRGRASYWRREEELEKKNCFARIDEVMPEGRSVGRLEGREASDETNDVLERRKPLLHVTGHDVEPVGKSRGKRRQLKRVRIKIKIQA